MSEQEVVPDRMRAIHLPPGPGDGDTTPSSSSLTYTDTYPTPTPSESQYLVQIHTVSLTRHELSLLSSSSSPTKEPQIPARNFCGVVISTPPNDMNRPDGPVFKIGDEVFGLLGLDDDGDDDGRDGAAADYVVAVEEEMAFKPRNITAAEAAGVPFGGLMAWQALEGAGLRSSLIDEAEGEGGGRNGAGAGAGSGKEEKGGDFIRVLVMGATSEVGRYIVQLLRANSAPFDGGIRRRRPRRKGKHEDRKEIFWIGATCSPSSSGGGGGAEESFLRNDLGVDEIIPLETQDGDCKKLSQTFTERGLPPVDVVLDCYEDDHTSPDAARKDIAVSLASSPHIVRRDGGWEVLKLNQRDWSVEMVDVIDKSISTSSTSSAPPPSSSSKSKNKSWSFTVRPRTVQLGEIAEVIEKGEMRPTPVEREFGLYEGREAMGFVEGGGNGKGVRGKVVLRVNS